jgi:hypothetical protein
MNFNDGTVLSDPRSATYQRAAALAAGFTPGEIFCGLHLAIDRESAERCRCDARATHPRGQCEMCWERGLDEQRDAEGETYD